jgi:putative phosphoesterase
VAVGDARRGDGALRAERNLKIAALYDVHGMLSALEAVLDEVEREDVDLIVLGGDCIHGPQPRETLERLRGLGDRAIWIRGNADRAIAEAGGGDTIAGYVAQEIGPDGAAFLGGLPLTHELELDGLGRVLFCHATPRSDDEIVTQLTLDERLAEILAGVEADVVVAGHTHMQHDRRVGAVRWVNAGSVGLPYEGEVKAFWTLLGPGVEPRKTAFDVEAAIRAYEATARDDLLEYVENFQEAPSRDETARYFESLVPA